MYLKKLQINGFKSFADKTVLSFPKPQENRFNIIGIVGPNGSGKSNISESIQWGLGEQSIKSLRGKKAADIIFSGSEKRQQKNKSEVILHFDNQNSNNSIKYKEFTITRTIYRDGNSEYKINNEEVRLKDILLLLAKTNFGQKSYSIINQGMVDQILVSSPKERKEFFDEATGIKKYIYKKDHAINKIERSQENLREAEIALKEITPRMNSLTRQVQKLSKKKEVEEKLTKLQVQYYGQKIKNINFEIKKQERKKVKLSKQQNDIKKTLDNLQNESKKIVYKKQQNQYQELQEKQQKILDQKSELISKQSELRVKIQIFENQLIQKLEKQKNSSQNNDIKVTDSKKLFENINKIKEFQQKELKSIKEANSLSDLQNIQATFQTILNQINHLFDFFKKNLSNQEDNRDFYKEKENIKNLKINLKNIDQETKNIDQKLKEIKNNISEFNNKEQEKREKLLKWQQNTQKKQSILNNINNQLNQINIETTRFETKKEDLEIEIKNEMDLSIEDLLKKDIKNDYIDYSQISKLKHQLSIIGGIDPTIEDEYPKVKERYEFLSSQTTDLYKTIKSLLEIVEELDQKIEITFKQKFSKINQVFNEYFQTIFGGGKAKIAYQEKDEEDIETKGKSQSLITGVDIFACPPDKKIKNIEMLSGGERALTALALICAIISINKPPFVVLDEADTSLDQKNSSRFASILKKLRKHTQFILITHNQQSIQIADILYGTTMTKTGASKLVSLKLEEEEN